MTNKRKVMLTLFCLIGYLVVFCQTETPALWYSKPAKTWTEALPVGNGRLGAMIYGDYLHENIQPTRPRADLILKKGADHLIEEVALRKL